MSVAGSASPVTGTGTGRTDGEILARLGDEYWWRWALRTVYARQFEQGAIQLGLVHSRKGKYVSDETVDACNRLAGVTPVAGDTRSRRITRALGRGG